MALWPDIVTEPLGDWLLRDSATSTARRANSVMAFGPAGVPDAYERVVAHYERPVANVLPDSAEDALFRGHGWVTEGHEADTVFMLASTARVARGLPRGLPAAVAGARRSGRGEGGRRRPGRRVRGVRRRLGRVPWHRGRRPSTAGGAWRSR